MENIYYYIYCKGILGVKTNIRKFKWVYGSFAPSVSVDEYEKCVVKFDICIKPEKQLNVIKSYDKRFQAYMWNDDSKTLSCRRTLPLSFEIGYDIKIFENTVVAEIGEHYYKYIKNRIMNLHGIYYLLSDLANVILLSKGFITLYASAVYFEPLKKGVVNFAPPNTGKTLTATKLCEVLDYTLVGEDVVISDGYKLYSCPWTNSYRRSNKLSADSAGALGRSDKGKNYDIKEECCITDLMVLSLGNKKISTNKGLITKNISILNGYLFNYFSTPIVKLLGYFDQEYYINWNESVSNLLENIINSCNCYNLQSENSTDFYNIIHEIVIGEN